RQFRRDRPAGRKGRAAHPAVGTARLRLTPDRVGTPRRHRAGRSHPHKARPRAALLLGRAGAASRIFGAVPWLIAAHRRRWAAAALPTKTILSGFLCRTAPASNTSSRVSHQALVRAPTPQP